MRRVVLTDVCGGRLHTPTRHAQTVGAMMLSTMDTLSMHYNEGVTLLRSAASPAVKQRVGRVPYVGGRG